jgi:hypothetical protein
MEIFEVENNTIIWSITFDLTSPILKIIVKLKIAAIKEDVGNDYNYRNKIKLIYRKSCFGWLLSVSTFKDPFVEKHLSARWSRINH